LDRSAAPVARTGLARLHIAIRNDFGFFLSELPPGCPKGMSSDHHCWLETWFLETRKGVPTIRAGTPDAPHLELPTAFAKGFFMPIS
jgi:hypothetical protein